MIQGRGMAELETHDCETGETEFGWEDTVPARELAAPSASPETTTPALHKAFGAGLDEAEDEFTGDRSWGAAGLRAANGRRDDDESDEDDDPGDDDFDDDEDDDFDDDFDEDLDEEDDDIDEDSDDEDV